MKQELEQLLLTSQEQVSVVDSLETLNKVKFEIIDKKDSTLSALSLKMRDLSKDERPEMGKMLNSVRQQIVALFDQKKQQLIDQRMSVLADREWEDMTFPIQSKEVGHSHPLTEAYYEIISIFGQLGFHFYEGPEVEWQWFSFGALNMPDTHPASDDFETYYIKHEPHPKYGRMHLRPHTSNSQVRSMWELEPPIRVVVPGKTYRPNYDTSHSPMFHQFEGILVDRNVTIGNLVGTLDFFVKKFFGDTVKTRIRPYHFQFTEPSFEVDISCTICGGEGCRLCKEGWLELGGAGMIHPVVLQNGGIDPKEFNGFAFGWGIERCVNIRSGIPDVRMLYEGELRLLKQF